MKALLSSVGLVILGTAISATAQEAPCGLTTMSETVRPFFPPIAKAAHIEGVVVMLAKFDTSGAVQMVEVISGPEMLRQSAINSVKTWHANPYSGPRTCPVAVTFHLQNPGEQELPLFVRPDVQHVVLNSWVPMLNTSNYSISTSSR